jgi:molybdate/tungstate transport system ATP-binding protein
MIALNHVSIELDTFAVHDVSFSIAAGEFFMLLGPTGAGKTVLLEAIAGLIPVTRGQIICNEQDVTHYPPEQRGIGIVYQDYALFPHLSVYDNITYGLRYHTRHLSDADDWVAWLINELDIQGLVQRTPINLSGGEKQRVALARALAVRPSALLLDEPLSALDPNFREDLRELLKKLHQDLNITFLMVTHDFTEALFLGQRAAIINNGAIEQLAPVLTVFQQPATPFVAEFVGMKNVFPAAFHDSVAKIEDVTLHLETPAQTHHRYIGIRVEDIQVGPQISNQEGENVFEGRIRKVSNRGLFQELTLQTGQVQFRALLTRSAFFETHLPEQTSIPFAIKPANIHTF